ncbi:iron ABC transporter substrate-binding protein [Vagococcus lutrae]|nr:ABC transporter substrate-binding protein [Vagococcus lutrae]MDO5742307.1 ABC transporter substrate-binding protein [Vagococcus sp.]GEQ61080.1 iron ABC transporter substrate-binding protein [Vagococcus lutrae]GEQ62985.1 iron ABC transporter substrate-binding protein [Vagococcus lutrae]GEQ64876.1 iron ABC transporter substrate-binding protein [Vagococcus lutrae]
MKKWMSLAVLGIMIGGLVGCGKQETKTSEAKDAADKEVVTVQDGHGQEFEIMKNPQKIVVFDMGSLDTIHALEESEKVVGVPQKNLPSYLSEFESVSSVGGLKEPDLEKINQLKPDLIIISGRQEDYQETLSAIAPTLYVALESGQAWEDTLKNIEQLGQILDKESEAKSHIDSLKARRDQLHEKIEKKEEKALITLVNEGQLSAYGSGSRFGIIHDAFGYKQADDTIEASTHGQSVSFEYVLEKNPDVLFIIDRTQAIGGDTHNNNIESQPLIAETTAAQKERLVRLDPEVWYLSGGGIESLNRMMDDLEK